MEGWLSQMGTGTKHISERYAEYPAPAHDQQLYYTYEPSTSSHGHGASSKHHYSGSGHKSNAAMSALTLLAFLFFLHILQQCLKEHMTSMSTPQVMVVSAGREGEQLISKTPNTHKMDKTGIVEDVTTPTIIKHDVKFKNNIEDQVSAPNSSTYGNIFLTRIATAQHTPNENHKYKNKIDNRGSILHGF